MRSDLLVWKEFLSGDNCYCRPFADFSKTTKAIELNWFADSCGGVAGGLGLYFDGSYAFGQWGSEFILKHDPSIAFLELYAVACSIELWANRVKNKRVLIHVDNLGVVNMINNSTSSCHLCMKLIRIITLTSLKHNVRFFAEHVAGKTNVFADLLSRNRVTRFKQLANKADNYPTPLPKSLWPIDLSWWK